MIVLKIDQQQKVSKKIISEIASRVKQGELIFFPTDTAYALGGRFDKKSVINKILKLKNRNDDKFTLVAANIKQVEEFFSLTSDHKKITKAFWPGALTIVVNKKFSVRVPNSDFLKHLSLAIGVPLIATSANISGQKTPYSAQEIVKQFSNNKLADNILLIDSGRLKKVKTSTIIEVKNKTIKIIRIGAVPMRELKDFIKKNPDFSLIKTK